jgi:hypothetical protein
MLELENEDSHITGNHSTVNVQNPNIQNSHATGRNFEENMPLS